MWGVVKLNDVFLGNFKSTPLLEGFDFLSDDRIIGHLAIAMGHYAENLGGRKVGEEVLDGLEGDNLLHSCSVVEQFYHNQGCIEGSLMTDAAFDVCNNLNERELHISYPRCIKHFKLLGPGFAKCGSNFKADIFGLSRSARLRGFESTGLRDKHVKHVRLACAARTERNYSVGLISFHDLSLSVRKSYWSKLIKDLLIIK